MIYSRRDDTEWRKCRFAFPLRHCAWESFVAAAMVPEWEKRETVQLGADGALRRSGDSPRLNPVHIAIFPEPTANDPAPATIIVSPDSLDMLGLRATVNGLSRDILSPAGRRQLSEADFDPVIRDVADWACELGQYDLDFLSPRFAAGLMVENRVRVQGPALPNAVTLDGLARWQLAQSLREELNDECFPKECKRALQELTGREDHLQSPAIVVSALSPRSTIRYDEAAFSVPAFAQLTTTPEDDIVAATFAKKLNGVAEDAEAQGWERIDETWTRQALEKANDCLSIATLTSEGPRFEMQFLTRPYARGSSAPATDMLLVADPNATHAFVWPTWQRQSMAALGKMHMVSAIEIPSMEEVQRLAVQVRVRARRLEALQDSVSPAPLAAPAM